MALPVFSLAQRELQAVRSLDRNDINFLATVFPGERDLLAEAYAATFGDQPLVTFSLITLGGDVIEFPLIFAAAMLLIAWAWQRLSFVEGEVQSDGANPLLISTLDLPPPFSQVNLSP